MNQLRQPFSELSPEVYKGLVQASIALEKSTAAPSVLRNIARRCAKAAWRKANWMPLRAGG